MSLKRTLISLLCVSMVGLASNAGAASYPERPITLVMPYATGGFGSTLAHIVAEGLEGVLGQSVVVDNRPGANGNLGSRQVAAAAPDGYTLILTTSAVLCINPALYPNVPFDSVRDFDPVAQVITTSLIGVVTPESGIESITDFVAKAQKNPGTMTFGSSGVGSLMHLSGELLKIQTGIDMLHVPYKGGGPAVVDLMGGRINLMFSDTNVLPHIKSGKLKALAVTGEQRMPALPDTPTVAEAGIEGYSTEAWYAIMAPAGTPKPAIQTLSAAVDKVLADPEIRTKLENYGVSPATDTSPEHVRQLLLADLEKWREVVHQGNITVTQ